MAGTPGPGLSQEERVEASLGHALGGIIAPALVGNVIGGTGLFALLAYAQVREEL